jgi:hypothetical protein
VKDGLVARAAQRANLPGLADRLDDVRGGDRGQVRESLREIPDLSL